MPLREWEAAAAAAAGGCERARVCDVCAWNGGCVFIRGEGERSGGE